MSKKRRTKSRRAFRLKLKRGTAFSVAQVAFLVGAALVIVSFSRQGIVLVRFNDFLVEQLSWASLLLPFIFISAAFLMSKFKIPIGQPNVLIGALVFFISVTTITRAGAFGATAWEGIASLITSVGAFVILIGTSIVGLIILFNTSFDQIIEGLRIIHKYIRFYLLGEKTLLVNGKGKALSNMPRGQLKVFGGPSPKDQKKDESKEQAKEVLEEKLVSNVKGEQKVWKYPPLSILEEGETGKAERGDIKGNAATIEQTLESFGITARVVEVNLGPAVTQYALEVALGTKLSKITALERDLALALAAPTGTIRIEAPIPGRSLVGIELPNRSPELVPLKKVMESDEMKQIKSKLGMAIGLDVSGKSMISDLGKMPHVLIAGQTGSGKSVCINSVITTYLFRASPSEIKFIMVDPKRVELTNYNGIPHLLAPVITDPEKVISALRWLMSEMDRRYKLFSQAGARNIEAYNEMSGFQALPYIILVIDELADIMLFSPVEVEDAITRIAQMSRATGIHMVLATQRPSVDVITGLIKANIPARIAFAVASQVDSRVILDTTGAEKLLGRGDMLFLPPDKAKPIRIQGTFLNDREINELTKYLRNQGVEPQYTEEVTTMQKAGHVTVAGISGDVDDLFKQAVEEVVQYDRASASLLQRRLRVGYARAARLLDQLEAAGVVGPAEGSKPREVLIRNAEEILGAPPNQNQPQTN
ncbi:DNA translocase FtsK [Candidatus Woesebacteria bacterium]|nr:DNA translocase FtsK [Candidatus Woesebacteria bacterium]